MVSIDKRTLTVFFALFLVFAGCLGAPKPLNEMGFIQQQNYSSQTIHEFNPQSFQNNGLNCSLGTIESMKNFTMYVKGNNTRSEYFDSKLNSTYITIIKGEFYYIKGGYYENQSKNCTWMHFNKDTFNKLGAQNISYGVGILNYTLIPRIPKCIPANFRDEIFEINGNVCEHNISE